MKTNLTAKKKSWAEEKTLLTQHAKKAEAALEEVTTELTGLKNRVSQMVSAIFGKPSVLNFLPSFAWNISRLLSLCSKNTRRSTKQKSEPRQCDQIEGGLYLGGAIVYWRSTSTCHHLPCQPRTQSVERCFEEVINVTRQVSRGQMILCQSRSPNCPEPLQSLGARSRPGRCS